MKPIEILCPVKGTWSFMNPPGHHPDAKDFVAVDKTGKPYRAFRLISHLFYILNVKKTFSWAQPVYAPFDGDVIKAENTRKDRKNLNLFRDLIVGLILMPRKRDIGLSDFLGNHAIIKSDDGVYALFAHLKEGSVTLKEGMRVKVGDPIAEVGNSGNTIQPHLHFQVMSENDPSASIPRRFVLTEYEVRKKSHWVKKYLALPENFEVCKTI